MDTIVHATYSSSLSSLCEMNSSFDSGILRIAYTGANRNGSYISKDAFERSIKTMYNCPIVCNYDRDTDSIGGHDIELVADSDGSMRIVNSTIPVGVIPESSKYFWSIVEEEDGTEHEYLCADVLIWKRQEAYKKIKEDGITAHSMELTVKDGEVENGVYVIKDFEFTAFCLLGDGHEPCFESSSLSMFSLSEVKDQMTKMMSDLKESFCDINLHAGDVDTNKFTVEGGEEVLDKKIALVAEYGFEVDKLGFSIEDMDFDALKSKLEDMKKASDFELEGLLNEEIRNALSAETVECSWGEMQRYCFIDYDREASEVYCYDTTDWKMYGFTYSLNGDSVIIDFACKKRKKYSIVDFDEGEQTSQIANIFENISTRYSENDTAWSEKYNASEARIATLESELEELKQYKLDSEAEKKTKACEDVLSKFEDLAGVEDFETLKEHCTEYDADVLEEKCFAIRGRLGTTAKFSVGQKQPKLMVAREGKTDEEPYGGLFTKYVPNC